MSLADLIKGVDSRNSKNSANSSSSPKKKQTYPQPVCGNAGKKDVFEVCATAIPAIPAIPSANPDFGKKLPPALTWQFVCFSPFTRSMVLDAAEVWGEPLSPRDITDIESGVYLFEKREDHLRTYLRDWAAENPEQMIKLKEYRCQGDDLPRASAATLGELPYKAHRNFWMTPIGMKAWQKAKQAFEKYHKPNTRKQ